MTTDPKYLILQWTDALNRGDGAAAAACFTDDGEWRDRGTGQRHVGRAALAAVWSSGLFTELDIRKTTFVVEGDTVAFEWTMSGRHSGDAPGLPATGRRFRLSGAGFAWMRDGRIARVSEYWNLTDLLTQVGLVPAPQG